MRGLFLYVFILFCGLNLAQVNEPEWVFKSRASTLKAGKIPVLVLLHGYGSNEEDLFDLSATIDSRYAIYSLRAPISLGNGGFAWYGLNRDSNKKLVYNYKEAASSREMVMRFILQQCRTNHLDSNAVVLLGFSQGAMLSYDMALSFPGKIKGVLALSGRLMEESKVQKKPIQLKSTSFFIAHGTNDELIAVTESEKAKDYLKLMKAKDIVYKTYAMQHVLNGQEIIDIRAWLQKFLAPTVPVKKEPQTPAKK